MPFKSPHPDIAIPKTDVWSFLFARAGIAHPPSHTLLIDPGSRIGNRTDGPLSRSRSYTFADLRRGTSLLGHALSTKHSLLPHTVAALYTPNTIDLPLVTWAIHWAGATVSPANPAYTVKELAFQLKDTGAIMLFTQTAQLETAKAACAIAGIADDMIFLVGNERHTRFKHITDLADLTDSDSVLTAHSPEELPARPVVIKPDQDLAFLVYSSGTTGHPKGVMLTHWNIVANILQVSAGEQHPLTWNGGPDRTGDKILGFLPMFHIYGLTVMVHISFYNGLPLVVMPSFALDLFCQHVQTYKVAFAYVVPPVVLLLSKHPISANYDLSSMQMMNSGAAPLTAEIVTALWDRLKLAVKQGYGMSETSPTTHVQSWPEFESAVGSSGKLLPCMEGKFVGEDGVTEVTGPDQTGELWLKGPNVFKGYWNRPELSAEVFSADGYYKTGDVGYNDRSGNLYITDRLKELIKYKGFQVPPAELEGLLLSHPDIDDVALIGVYDPSQATELPRAYVVLSPAANALVGRGGEKAKEATAKEIAGWVATRVAAHKKIRGGVVFVDAIPKSAAGKILRRVLRDQAAKEIKAGSAKL